MAKPQIFSLNARLTPSLDSEGSPETLLVEKVALAAALIGVEGEVCWSTERFKRKAEEGAAWSPQYEFEHMSPLLRKLQPTIEVKPGANCYEGDITVQSHGLTAHVAYMHDFADSLRGLLVHLAAMVYMADAEQGQDRTQPVPEVQSRLVSLTDAQVIEKAAVVAGVEGELSPDGREFLMWPDHYYSWNPLQCMDQLMCLMPSFEHRVAIFAKEEGGGLVVAQATSRKGSQLQAQAPFLADIESAFMRAIVELARLYA